MATIHPGRLILACADLDARPLFWTEPNRQRHGYEPEVANLVAAHLGLEIVWRFLRWSEFASALESGEVDAIWCGCAITPERRQQFLFSNPYAYFDESVLVRADSGISGPADLAGRRVGAIAGSTNMTLAESWQGCEKVPFDGKSDDVFRDMIDALVRGEIDAVVDDEPAFGAQRENPAFDIAFTVPTQNAWGAAMRPSHTELKSSLDTALESLRNNCQIDQAWKTWLPDIAVPQRFACQ